MPTISDQSVVSFDWAKVDLRVMCGPRYNAFVPAAERREEPDKFFQRSTWKQMPKPRPIDDDHERWDGLE